MTDYISLIISMIAGIASISAILLAWRKAPVETEQIKAQTASTKIDTVQRYEAMVARYAEEMDVLRNRLDMMEANQKLHDTEIAELRAGVVLLIAQLEANHIIPIWRPKDKSKP